MAKPAGRSHAAPLAGPPVTRYTRVAIVLHWLIAALVLSTIPLGVYGASTQSPAPPQVAGSQAIPAPATVTATVPAPAGPRAARAGTAAGAG